MVLVGAAMHKGIGGVDIEDTKLESALGGLLDAEMEALKQLKGRRAKDDFDEEDYDDVRSKQPVGLLISPVYLTHC